MTTNLPESQRLAEWRRISDQIHDDIQRMIRVVEAGGPEMGPRGAEIGVKSIPSNPESKAYWAGWYDGREALRDER